MGRPGNEAKTATQQILPSERSSFFHLMVIYALCTAATTLTLPSVTEATPSAAETTPSVTEATPSVTEATPSVAEAMPCVTEATPCVTEATPSVTEATPYENYPALLSNDPLLGQLIVSPTEIIFRSQPLTRLVLKSWPGTWK